MSEETTQTTVSEQVESNNTPTTPTTPTSEPTPTTEDQPINSMGERPEWLPEKFKSAQDMAESYSQLEGKISQKEEDIRTNIMQELEADAYKDRPPTKGEYILPEGIDDELAKSNELLEWWADQAFENGYSQDEFAEGIEMYKKVANIGMTDPQKEMQQLGDNGQQRVQAVEMWSNKFFPAEQHAEIANLCATAEGVKAMETVMNALKGSSVLANTEVASNLSEKNLRTMMSDERYWNVAKRDPAFVAQVDDGFKKLYR